MYSFDKRPLVENSQRISASVFVRNYYFELKQKSSRIDLTSEEFVKKLIDMIEKRSTVNLKQESNGKIEFTKENKIQLTYTKSNLNKGFVFWFICRVCDRRVRYLYIPPNSQIFACRKCHRLAYKSRD